VSSAKFAAITASLLARKGDAAPSLVTPLTPPPRPALVPRHDQPVSSEPRQPDDPDKLRRIMVSMTSEELERLDIAAIKKGTNRHHIVRAALNDYFRKLSAEFPHPCACLESDSAVPHAGSEAKAAHPSYLVRAEKLDSAILADESRRETVVM
jgi:Ribbon-helix-helix protein, copG family